MKKITQRIIQKFPLLDNLLLAYNNGNLTDDDLQPLDSVEHTFLKLACFFEKPDQEHFDLSNLYKEIDNDWLEWALELITLYFREDTYLIQKPSLNIVRENDSNYLNQSQFAAFLTEKGLKYDRAKVKNYYDRGIIPGAGLIVSRTKYWMKSTVQQYCENELRRLKS